MSIDSKMIIADEADSTSIVFHGTKVIPRLFTRRTQTDVVISETREVLAVIPPTPNGSRSIQSSRKFRPIAKNVMYMMNFTFRCIMKN